MDTRKAKSATPYQEPALSTVIRRDYIAEQALTGIRAKLSCAGGQIVNIASDGAFVVVSPFLHITRFSNLSALQAYADGVRV